MPMVVIVLSIALMYLMAYTAAFQRTVRALGFPRAGESEGPASARPQVVILLGIYLKRLNAAFLLGTAVYLITSRASNWYYGVAVVVLCWIGSLLIGSMPWLRLGGAEMVAVLLADLERRRQWYRVAHDAARLHAVEELLARIRSIPRSQTRAELHRQPPR
jgi:hypothetical protein